MRGSSIIIYVAMAMMLSAVCALDLSVEQARPPTPKGESAAYALAGEFRTVAANLLWIKADKYHHEFIGHGGNWNENKDLLPLIKLITELDPHFIEAYLTGSWMLATGLEKHDAAVRYLREGISNNPKSFELYEGLATLYARRLSDPQKSLQCFEKALYLARDDFDRKRLKRLVETVREMCEEEKASGP